MENFIIDEEINSPVPVCYQKPISFYLEEICPDIDYLLEEDKSKAAIKMCKEYYTINIEASGELNLDDVIFDSDYKALNRHIIDDKDYRKFKTDFKMLANSFSRSIVKKAVHEHLERHAIIGVNEVRNGEWKFIDIY